MTDSIPTILIIIGITGDLSKRMLLPAISELAKANELPKDFYLIGTSRQVDVKKEDYIKNVAGEILQINIAEESEYQILANRLKEIEETFDRKAQRVFYLSIPPQVSRPVIEFLGKSGLAKVKNTKILLEKPFGTDIESAKELIDEIDRYFTPEQIYRIDHYLAKEMAQNLIVFRLGNSLFKHTWNRKFIEKIEIIASEKIGIEGRANFYEQTGALKDVVQSHLIQLAALTLMDLPETFDIKNIPQKRLAVLKSLQVVMGKAIHGQYEGYRQETENPNSIVETFAQITLASTSAKWKGVPIILTTGKNLDTKKTEIKVTYRQEDVRESNQLTLRLQPNEGIELSLWAKRPGYSKQIEQHKLHFSYRDHYENMPEAYERVLIDAINSDHNLFTSGPEVLEAWRIIEPIQKRWELDSDGLVFYNKGSKVSQVVALAD
jgi:glucose-6-phosphate 1-dehydrogenase